MLFFLLLDEVHLISSLVNIGQEHSEISSVALCGIMVECWIPEPEAE